LKRTYDNVALFYDRLARLIYGRALIEAQVYLIKAIPANANILIAGGGTGWILEELTRIHPSGLNITYIDISAKMIALAKKRNAGSNKVIFINAPILDVVIESTFDIVLTPFLLDNFTYDTLLKVFSQLNNLLLPNGSWLYCDFQNTNVLWQKTVLKIMYFFFRSLCGVETNHLPDVEKCFTNKSYKTIAEKTFVREFIVARIYKKDQVDFCFAAIAL